MGIRPESHETLLAIARQGLPRREGRPQRVVIVGAGMAGLVAAWELARAGHEPVVLEARARVGGRVHTLREPFTDGLYAPGPTTSPSPTASASGSGSRPSP